MIEGNRGNYFGVITYSTRIKIGDSGRLRVIGKLIRRLSRGTSCSLPGEPSILNGLESFALMFLCTLVLFFNEARALKAIKETTPF